MKEKAMPIYLVRWPDLSASLVRAEAEDHLVEILDQVANPEGCEWSVYEGPLFIDLRLPAEYSIRDERPGEPISPDQIVVGDLGPMAKESVLETIELSLAGGDDGFDTGDAVLRKAFPSVHAAIERLHASEEGAEWEGILPEADLREALHAEIARLLRASWRRAQLEKKTDPISGIAREMDMPVDLARRCAEAGLEKAEPGRNEGEPEEDE